MRRILIAGCGYAGSATADLFHAAGWAVEGWTRSVESVDQDSNRPYRVHAVDISNRTAVAATPDRFDVVIQCASTRGGGVKEYQQLYLEGARTLIEALSPERFIFCSSTSVYAQTGGEWVDEESAAKPVHETGKILRQAEDFVRQKGGGVARLAGIYGPGRSALLRKFLSGAAQLEKGDERYLNQAHRDDIARALFLLATLPDNPGVINVSDNEPMTHRQCYDWLARKLNRPIPPEGEIVGARKRGAGNKRVSNQKLRALGWEPQFPSFPLGMERSVLPGYPGVGAWDSLG